MELILAIKTRPVDDLHRVQVRTYSLMRLFT